MHLIALLLTPAAALLATQPAAVPRPEPQAALRPEEVGVRGRPSQAHDAVFFVEGFRLAQISSVAGDRVEECYFFGSQRSLRLRPWNRCGLRRQQRGGGRQKQRY